MTTTGPLRIHLNQTPADSGAPLVDRANRRHTIESVEFEWQGDRYFVHRDEAGPNGAIMRQMRTETEPGVERLEIIARRRNPMQHETAPWEHFLFRLSDVVKEGENAWSHAELIGYDVLPERRLDA